MPGWKKYSLYLFVTLFLFLVATGLRAQSVLQKGIWIKVGVTQTGMYRLSQEALAKIDPIFTSADPRRLRLFGNGGAPLPQANAAPRAFDLVENAIQVIGEDDGRFDRGDGILFFGQSPHTIRVDSTTRRLTHQINPYADTTFYFLTISDQPGRRIQSRVSASVSGSAITTFDDYAFYEKELTNIVKSGREWVGDYLGVNTNLTIPFNWPGLVTTAPLFITSSVVANALVPTKFSLQLNGQTIGTQTVGALSGYRYDYQGLENRQTFSVTTNATDGNLRVGLSYDKGGQGSSQGYLNFLGIQGKRELRQYSQPTVVRLPSGRYVLKQASIALRVWDITNPLLPVNQTYSLNTTTGEATWAASGSGVYVVFSDNQFTEPASVRSIANQNIRGNNTPDLLIVTAPDWRSEAERLAAFRRVNDQLAVLVVTTQQVYNEFASGQADPTAIRDMARFFYQQAPNKLKYLLLVGNATFDYRNIMQMQTPLEHQNTVPVYESRESLHPVESFSSDDYFGFLKDTDGEWDETTAGDQQMDIGVGRLPIRSIDDARTVVDKLIRYSTDKTLTGDWQTRVTFVADDGDANIHQADADQLARYIEAQSPVFRPERLFLDSFPQDVTPNGQQAPLVNKAINNAITEGRLIVNYTGHGGEAGWAEEQVLTLKDIFSWRNRRLPLFVTGTCEFGRYDDPTVRSGAELTMTSRLGGAIALLTTTRPVTANTNFLLNQAFYQSVFAPVGGKMPRLGDILRLTKNKSVSGSRNRNFTLLGDPSMRLAYPKAQIVLNRINGRNLTAHQADTLRALQTVTLEGEIRDEQQINVLDDFSGMMRLVVYDKATIQTTRGTESSPMTYKTFTSQIYSGRVTVQQGKFSVRFTVPKDIDYVFGQGRLYAYAVRADSLMDAAGSYSNLVIGGSMTPDTVDSQPPIVKLAIERGDLTGELPSVPGPDVTLIAQLTDNKGINLARSGLGHELTASLNDQSPVILNENYMATSNDGRRGEVRYMFRGLAAGLYVVRMKVWDINNNSGEGTLRFRVSDKPNLAIETLKAYPNPFVEQTTLEVTHNRPGEALDWTLAVFNQNGQRLSTQTGNCSDCAARVPVGSWNGRSDTGLIQHNGLYIYLLTVRSANDGSEATQSGRLILNR